MYSVDNQLKIEDFIFPYGKLDSNYIAGRISKYYRRESKVIFPPVNTHLYNISDKDENYYLIVSRLGTYKRIDLAVEAFNGIGLPLVIVGDGPQRNELEKMAKPNVRFLGRLSDEEIREYYSTCRAFIFPGEEDFGITPVECEASRRCYSIWQRRSNRHCIRWKDGNIL